MPKRFCQPNWKALRKLPEKLQRAWFYMWDHCDAAGVYHYDPAYMNIDLGLTESIPLESLALCPDCQELPLDRILLRDFIKVNYVVLSEKQNGHKAAFRDIEKNKLFLNSALTEASRWPEEKEEEEEEDKGGTGGNKIHPAQKNNEFLSVEYGAFKIFFSQQVKQEKMTEAWEEWKLLTAEEIDKEIWPVLPRHLAVHAQMKEKGEYKFIPQPQTWLREKRWKLPVDLLKPQLNGKKLEVKSEPYPYKRVES